MEKESLLLQAAVKWIFENKSKEPKFSTACGMVFNDNSDADDFDHDMGLFAIKNDINLSPVGVINLYFHALDEIKAAQ